MLLFASFGIKLKQLVIMSEELNTENTLEAKAEVAPVEPIVEKEAEVEAPAE